MRIIERRSDCLPQVMLKQRTWYLTRLACLFLLTLICAAQTRAETIVIGARIIDGTGREPIENGAIAFDGDKITAVGSAAQTEIPNGAQDESQYIFAEYPAWMQEAFFTEAVDPALLQRWNRPLRRWKQTRTR